MSKLLSALVLLLASTQIASATPTNFYLSGILDDYFATASGIITIDPTTGVVQPGDIFLSVEALPVYNLPAEILDLSLQSVSSTTGGGSQGFGYIDGITTLSYGNAAGTHVQIYISADSGSLIGYQGGLCTQANHANCISDSSGDPEVSFAYGTQAPGGNYFFDSGSLTSTPEPSSLALLGTGVLSACAVACRRLSERG